MDRMVGFHRGPGEATPAMSAFGVKVERRKGMARRRQKQGIAMTETTERIVLASRPVGEPTLDNFRLEELPIPQPGPDQMLLRTLWLSLDPYMRGRMSAAPSYAKPVGIGDVMEGGTISEVVASNIPRFAKGSVVVGHTGWQTYALSDGSSVQKVEPTRGPIQAALGLLGMPGMTAYMGLLEIGKPAAGETVVVAAASGARRSRVPRSRLYKPRSAQPARQAKKTGDFVQAAFRVMIALRPQNLYCALNHVPQLAIGHLISAAALRQPARKVSTSISRMSVARYLRLCFPSSIRSPALPCAG